MEFYGCLLGHEDARGFMNALRGAGCARGLTSLEFAGCELDAEGLRALADLLGRDIFPALNELCFRGNPDISDEGVMALTKALSKATQTFERRLDLTDVGLGDEGLVRVA